MKLFKTSLLSLVVATGLTAGSVYAQAQQDQSAQAPAMPQQAAPQIDVSEQQVSDFADAYVAVQTLSQEYRVKLQNAADAEQTQEIQQQAQADMKGAITESGLELVEYRQIAQAANQDEELRNRISAAITAITGQGEETEAES
ncbi:DUF4168 domain-containing protein [Gilvimarinus xylanilyticus]|uniref:DUF4168 domain-containing protein n=1 Tax=Gilvimarinus xylanilyticus TaxID=2944139 RepID=A0A9X2HZR4_9GAMM|nr:DUF4168 domain-containing protein [Gilvimarinus xylanilyticus]MCP8899506.1 DUF4168 domain-containing protein [Gilvimarinus xylanilyticus]